MARFINDEKELMDRNIDNMGLTTSIEYSKFLEGTPTFVTYYSKNIVASTEDKALGNVKSIVGMQSPLTYNIVEEFPLYGIDGINPIPNLDEFGLNYEIESSAIILPDTVRPNVDDYFTVDYNGEDKLFRIVSLEVDKLNGKKYYKINFILSPDDFRIIEEQVEEHYVSHYENIGTRKNNIIKKKDSLIIQHIIKLERILIDWYFRNYLDENFNFLTYKYNDKNLYNEYLIRFILNTDCLYTKKKFLRSKYIQDIMKDDKSIYYVYPQTLYWAVEHQDTSRLKLENIKMTKIQPDRNMPFYYHPEDFYRCQYCTEETNLFPHELSLIKKITKNEKYKDVNVRYLENIIIDFLNNQLEINIDLLNEIEQQILEPFLSSFILMPCLIYILQREKNILEQRIPERRG